MLESFVYTGKNSFEAIEFVLDEKEYKKTGKRVYKAYDADFYPLPDISKWNKKHSEKVLDFCKEVLKDEDGEIYIDDVLLEK